MRIRLRPHLAQQLSVLALSMSLMAACTVLPLAIDNKATAPELDGFGAATLVPSASSRT